MTRPADPPDPGSPARLLISVAPDPTYLLRARERLRDYLEQHCADEEAVDHVVLAVDEACSNALRHSGTDEDLEIGLGFEGDDLVVEIRDHGCGLDPAAFDPGHVPDPLARDGRGFYLMNRLVDDVELVSDGGLTVRLTKRGVRRPAAAEGDLSGGLDDDARDELHRRPRRRAVIEEMDEGFAALDWEYRFIASNPAATRLIGKSPEQLLGRTIWEVFPAAADLPIAEGVRRAMQLGDSTIQEFVSPSAGGWIECRIYPTSSGVSLFARDVDERKRKELERDELMAVLTENEARYRALFDHTPDAVLLTRADGSIDAANPAALALFGRSHEELTTLPRRELIQDDDPRLAAAIALRKLSGRVLGHELTGIRKGGERIPLEVDSVVLPDGTGRAFVLARDIGPRKRAEEALKRQADLLRLSFDAILLWRLGGAIEVWNRGAEDLYGFCEDEAVGRMPHELLRTVHPLPVDQLLGILRDQGSWEGELIHTARGGGKVVVLSRQQLIRGDDGVERVLETNRDVTERKQAEEALRRSEVEKAAQKERDRLARDLHDSVTQSLFASTMKAEALSVLQDPEEKRRMLEDLEHLNRGALAQMRSLLLELRGEPLENVPLETLVRYVAEAARGRASIAVHQTVRLSGHLPAAVHVAVYRITQEALNNVVRHSRANDAWVTLEADSTRALLTIRDDGAGFDPAAVGAAHLGVRSMRERAAEVGASFELTSEVGGGTVIRMEWPEG